MSQHFAKFPSNTNNNCNKDSDAGIHSNNSISNGGVQIEDSPNIRVEAKMTFIDLPQAFECKQQVERCSGWKRTP